MMDEKTKADYERAAVALEKHTKDISHDQIASMAWVRALDASVDYSGDNDQVDQYAARLLRECIARNEVIQKRGAKMKDIGKLTKEYAQTAEAVVGFMLLFAGLTAAGLLAGCIWGVQSVVKAVRR